ncbi:HK97-gp10 family putative phage morphogenesis protein [Micromonospora sp. NPDC004551]|uniref:HK97-gp10 family putative phage morphogenesis protein n=1 Tax=Micromonospora sp. NPDC004551 TaxID=3154284 RepID=UPI0033A82D93
MADVRVDVHERAVREVASSEDLRDLLMETGEPIEQRAAGLAPKRTGAGAASIRREPVLDGFAWTVRISWDREHYYMYFHDRGTERLPARPFLEPALEAAIGGI